MRDETVYRPLAEPMLIAGVEQRLLMLNIGILALIVWLFKFLWWPVLTWVAHQVLKALHRKDPEIRGVYLVYMRQADRHEPWVDPRARRNLRPENGYGRGAVL